jgi:hypothetical protein
MQDYVYVTKNTPQDMDTMNGYSGTTLLHTTPLFCVWLWTDPVQSDLEATQNIINPSVNLIMMGMINIVAPPSEASAKTMDAILHPPSDVKLA